MESGLLYVIFYLLRSFQSNRPVHTLPTLDTAQRGVGSWLDMTFSIVLSRVSISQSNGERLLYICSPFFGRVWTDKLSVSDAK